MALGRLQKHSKTYHHPSSVSPLCFFAQVCILLGVRREYLWQLSGLLDDMDYGPEVPQTDPRLKFYFAKVDRLPENVRNLIINILKSVADYFQPPDNEKTPSTD
jgi:hypothetical protein